MTSWIARRHVAVIADPERTRRHSSQVSGAGYHPAAMARRRVACYVFASVAAPRRGYVISL